MSNKVETHNHLIMTQEQFDEYWAQKVIADKAAIDALVALHAPPPIPLQNPAE